MWTEVFNGSNKNPFIPLSDVKNQKEPETEIKWSKVHNLIQGL